MQLQDRTMLPKQPITYWPTSSQMWHWKAPVALYAASTYASEGETCAQNNDLREHILELQPSSKLLSISYDYRYRCSSIILSKEPGASHTPIGQVFFCGYTWLNLAPQTKCTCDDTILKAHRKSISNKQWILEDQKKTKTTHTHT